MTSLPFVIAGKVYDTDGTTALANVKVTLRNERTNETLTQNTNSSGEYLLDCANLTTGWTEGDVITVFTLYTNYEDYEEYTIVSSDGGKDIDLTLVVVPASDSLKYYTVQDFYDYFNLTAGNDGVPLTNQVVSIGTMVEKEIDEKCQSEFSTSTTITQEYHDAKSAYQFDWFTEFTPILSITTFQVNTADEDETASWSTLTEADNQIKVSLDTGRIRITGDLDDSDLTNFPEPGVKQVRVTYTYGRTSVPKDIKKLAILMTARDVMQGTVARALFRGQDSFKTNHYNVFDKQIKSLSSKYLNYDIINT